MRVNRFGLENESNKDYREIVEKVKDSSTGSQKGLCFPSRKILYTV